MNITDLTDLIQAAVTTNGARENTGADVRQALEAILLQHAEIESLPPSAETGLDLIHAHGKFYNISGSAYAANITFGAIKPGGFAIVRHNKATAPTLPATAYDPFDFDNDYQGGNDNYLLFRTMSETPGIVWAEVLNRNFATSTGTTSRIQDADNDTSVDVEVTADADVVVITAGGNTRGTFADDGDVMIGDSVGPKVEIDNSANQVTVKGDVVYVDSDTVTIGDAAGDNFSLLPGGVGFIRRVGARIIETFAELTQHIGDFAGDGNSIYVLIQDAISRITLSTPTLRLSGYTSVRDDGATTKALYVDGNGDVKYGDVAGAVTTAQNHGALAIGQSPLVARGLGISELDWALPNTYVWGRIEDDIPEYRGQYLPNEQPTRTWGYHADKVSACQMVANKFAADTGNITTIIPSAVGGTAFGNGGWQQGGEWYEKALADGLAFLAQSSRNKISFIFICIGQTDASSGTLPATYEALFDTHVANLYADLGLSFATCPLLVVGIPPEDLAGDAALQALEAINKDARNRLTNTYWVGAESTTSNPGDAPHWDASSSRLMGRRIAEVANYAIYGGTPLPHQTINVQIVPDSGELAVSWDATFAALLDVANYRVEFKLDTEPTVWTLFSSPSGTAETITGLTDGLLYNVRVRAENANGNGPWSDIVSDTPASSGLPSDYTFGLAVVGVDTYSTVGSGGFTATEHPTLGVDTINVTPEGDVINSEGAAFNYFTTDAELEGTYSIAFQVRRTTTASHLYIIGGDGSDLENQFLAWIPSGQNAVEIAHDWNAGTEQSISAGNLTVDGAFHQVVMTFNGTTRQANIYIDNTSTPDATATFSGDAYSTGLTNFNLMRHYGSAVSGTGLIRKIFAWNRELSGAEAAQVGSL